MVARCSWSPPDREHVVTSPQRIGYRPVADFATYDFATYDFTTHDITATAAP